KNLIRSIVDLSPPSTTNRSAHQATAASHPPINPNGGLETAAPSLLDYLISTLAPAASIFFFISSASALVTPSLIVLGAPSTSAFASASPSLGTSPRTSLITPILFAPICFMIGSKVFFSLTAGSAVPPPLPAP